MSRIKTILINCYGMYAALVVVLCVTITGVVLLLAPGLARRRRIARCGLRVTFFCVGLSFTTSGQQRLPAEPCVVIANHRSYLDGLVLIAALPPRFTPVIKAEVSRVPVLGLILRRIGARYVQREPTLRAARDTKRLLDALRQGESLAVFPEGTFSVDDGLLPFRGGAFFLAAKANVAVVAAAIRGTRDVLPLQRKLPCPAAVTVDILAPMHAAGSGRDHAQALRDRTEAALWQGLEPRTALQSEHAPNYAYYRDLFRDQQLPQAYLDLDLLEANIRRVLDRSGNKNLRVDASALRSPAVIDRVLRSNIRFHGVKCATGQEAVHLAREWALEDMLVAYPTLQSNTIEQVCRAVADGCEMTMTADSLLHLRCLSNAAAAAGVTLPVCVEMDLSNHRMSHRTAVRTLADLQTLVSAIGAHEHLCFRGVLAFDTQWRTLLRWFASPHGRGRPARWLGADARRELHHRRHAVVEHLAAAGAEAELLNGGGAGSMEFNAADPSVTEITVGSALFTPASDDPEFEQPPAAGFAAEIMRRPSDDLYICLGGGYTAADTFARDALPRPYLPAQAVLQSPRGCGEAHVPIRYAGELRLGDPIFLRSPNAGELCERFSRLRLIQGGAVVGSAATYRALGAQLAPRAQ